MSADTVLDNVDIETVGVLVRAIEENPEKARTTWAAHVARKGALASESTVRLG
ncbi:hypothetical protein [Nocardia harenae]|uniref:hypothetical protein n=1 Tax=Nocardia harenae TaxID=358707 RepID=UPI000AB84BB7|nr:hypothetical protein [Nocardia harenae]